MTPAEASRRGGYVGGPADDGRPTGLSALGPRGVQELEVEVEAAPGAARAAHPAEELSDVLGVRVEHVLGRAGAVATDVRLLDGW